MPNRVRELRKRRRLTQEKLAEKCETSHATIQRIESGKMDLASYWAVTIAKALEVHPGALFSPLPIDDEPLAVKVLEIYASLPREDLEGWTRHGDALRLAAQRGPQPIALPAPPMRMKKGKAQKTHKVAS